MNARTQKNLENSAQAELILTQESEDVQAVLRLRGQWLRDLPRPKAEAINWPQQAKMLIVDGEQVISWDTTLLVFLHKIKQKADQNNLPMEWQKLPSGVSRLLQLASAQAARATQPKSARKNWLEKFGLRSLQAGDKIAKTCGFLGELTISLPKLCLGMTRMRLSDLAVELVKAGPQALAIVSLIGFLMGLILAFIGAIPLQWFGAEVYVASLLGIGILRLMGAVMTGVVMAGRTGASYAAELGTMQVNEEIDALQAMGISAIEFLVLPRFLALTLMMPLLGLYGNLVGLFGGLLVYRFYLDMTMMQYWQQLIETTKLADLLVGLFTCWVFGMLIACCGCWRGLQCGRSSEAVGKATTGAVVSSIVGMVLATAAITLVTVALKI